MDQLDELAELTRSSGFTMSFSRTGVGCSALIGATSYRVVQEALTNAQRHGGWRTVDVVVNHESHGTMIIVSNPVEATTAVARTSVARAGGERTSVHCAGGERPRLGLTGIRERVAEHGGEVWTSRTADLFTLRTWIPAER